MSERTCLIVDDQPEIRAYLKLILQHKDLETLEASNAAEALQIVRKIDGIVLVITDIQMPGDMDGVELARSLKTSHPALPVILMSGFSNRAETDGFIFIRKPFPPGTIAEIIDDLLISGRRLKTGHENWHGRHAS